MKGWTVTETIENARGENYPDLKPYPLLPGDFLTVEDDGSYFKQGPGLGIGGIVLTEEQKATLKADEKWIAI